MNYVLLHHPAWNLYFSIFCVFIGPMCTLGPIIGSQKQMHATRHWRDSRSRENLERKWSIFFYLELENWIFISRDALECQDFEEKILVLLSKFEILKKNTSRWSCHSWRHTVNSAKNFLGKIVLIIWVFNGETLLPSYPSWCQITYKHWGRTANGAFLISPLFSKPEWSPPENNHDSKRKKSDKFPWDLD